MGRHAKDPNVTTEYLHECFKYDETSGNLIWKERPIHHFKSEKKQKEFNRKHANKRADFDSQRGYLKVSLNNKRIMSHRVIWKLKTNQWPAQYIDHIDGNGQNNKWINLREASHHDNMKNRKNHKNKGYKGIKKNKTGYTAHITINKKNIRIGFYKTELEARQAYYIKAKELFREFTRIENEEELLPIPKDILERGQRKKKVKTKIERSKKIITISCNETQEEIDKILHEENTDMKYISYSKNKKTWRFRLQQYKIEIVRARFKNIIQVKKKYFENNNLL